MCVFVCNYFKAKATTVLNVTTNIFNEGCAVFGVCFLWEILFLMVFCSGHSGPSLVASWKPVQHRFRLESVRLLIEGLSFFSCQSMI